MAKNQNVKVDSRGWRQRKTLTICETTIVARQAVVARHCNDVTFALERFNNAHFLIGGDTGENDLACVEYS